MTTTEDTEPLDLGDVPLDELYLWHEQWPAAGETDQDRVDFVRQIINIGLIAARLSLGIIDTEPHGDTFVHTALATDCPHCLAGRSKQKLAAEYSLIVAEQLATFDDWPDPVALRNEIDWNLRLIVAACDDARGFREHRCV